LKTSYDNSVNQLYTFELPLSFTPWLKGIAEKPHSRYKQLHGNYVGIFIYLICDLLLMIFNEYSSKNLAY